jgi:putative methyltransferase (TIGR04325 family)
MLKRILKRALRLDRPINSFRGVFANFDEAARHVPQSRRVGYDVPETAGWYRQRLDDVQHDDYPMLYWFEKAMADSRTIVEIGGHVGVAYYPFTRIVACPEDLRWTIVDVAAVTRAGAQLARERGRTNLHFANDLSEVSNGCDILMASGSLQYLHGDLLPERVRKMVPLPKHIIINKTPVREAGDGYVTLQNLGVSLCPYRIHGKDDLIAPLERLGYAIVATWRKDREVIIPGRPDLTVEHYGGFYLRRVPPNAAPTESQAGSA